MSGSVGVARIHLFPRRTTASVTCFLWTFEHIRSLDVLNHFGYKMQQFFSKLCCSSELNSFQISLLQLGSHQPVSLFTCALQEQGDIENAKKTYLDYTFEICIAFPLEVQLYILYTLKSRHT